MKIAPAPVTEDDPRIERLEEVLTRAIDRNGDVEDKRETARDHRFQRWDGQSHDGLKHAEDMGVDESEVFPWEGAGDSRVMLADNIINEKVALLVEAFFRAKVQAHATKAAGMEGAQRITTLLTWLRDTEMALDFTNELELAAQYLLGDDPGVAAVCVYWKREYRMRMRSFEMPELVELVMSGAQEMDQRSAQRVMANLPQLFFNPELRPTAISMLEAAFPMARKAQINRALDDLAENQPVRLPVKEIKRDAPCVRAYRLNEDFFIPEGATDIQTCEAVYTREYYTEDALLAMIENDGWDEDAVRDLVSKGRGARYHVDNTEPKDSEDDETDTDRHENDFEVYTAWRKTPDKSGVPWVWRTVWAPAANLNRTEGGRLVKIALKHDPVEYGSCDIPIFWFMRERLSRSAFDSRGITRVCSSSAMEIKTQRDGRVNHTQLATVPAVKKAMRIQAATMTFGPAAEVAMKPGDDVSFIAPPPFPQSSVEMENRSRADMDDYFGRTVEGVPPEKVQLVNSMLVRRWTNGWRWLWEVILGFCQENLDPGTWVKVTGADPVQISKDDLGGTYGLTVAFDPRELDIEFLKLRSEYYEKLMAMDTAGVLDRAGYVKFMAAAFDPTMADVLVRDVGPATEAEAAAEVDAVAKMAVGIEPAVPTQGNWQLRMQVLQDTIKKSPKLSQQYQQDEVFQKLVEQRAKAFTFQMQQIQNKQIGRTGFMPALGGQPSPVDPALAATGVEPEAVSA